MSWFKSTTISTSPQYPFSADLVHLLSREMNIDINRPGLPLIDNDRRTGQLSINAAVSAYFNKVIGLLPANPREWDARASATNPITVYPDPFYDWDTSKPIVRGHQMCETATRFMELVTHEYPRIGDNFNLEYNCTSNKQGGKFVRLVPKD